MKMLDSGTIVLDREGTMQVRAVIGNLRDVDIEINDENVRRRVAVLLENAVKFFEAAGHDIDAALAALDRPDTAFIFNRLDAFRSMYHDHERFYWTFGDAANDLRAQESQLKGGETDGRKAKDGAVSDLRQTD